jgi:hypothetical protein
MNIGYFLGLVLVTLGVGHCIEHRLIEILKELRQLNRGDK